MDEKPYDGRMTEEPWDEALRQKLMTAPYKDMKQGGVDDVSDPPGLIEQSDDEIARLINAELVDLPPTFVDVQAAQVIQHLTLEGLWRNLNSIAQAADELGGRAYDFVELLRAGGSIRTSDAKVREKFILMLDGLKGALTDDQISHISSFAISKRQQPYWQSIGAPGPFNRFDFYRVRHP